ncbi:phosphoribosylanthranilate isomerase [Paenibacillus marinisediminis]
MNVKICGIQDAATGVQVARLKPDHIGFVFAPSRRQVTPPQAASIIDAIRCEISNAPEMVGVYARADRSEMERVLANVPLDAVQFLVCEDLSIAQWIKDRWSIKIWLTMPIPANTADAHDEREQLIQHQFERLSSIIDNIDVLLLDTHDPVHGGGSGHSFQWDVIPAYLAYTKRYSIPLYAAGGLHTDNIAKLKASYDLQGVDVSSGVETNGVKDLIKVQSFIERVKS